METKKNRRKEHYEIARHFSLISQVGISMMVPIFLCVFMGIYISNKTGKDIIVLFAIILGFAVAFRNAYYLVKGFFYKDFKEENKKQEYFDNMTREREKRLGSHKK